MAKFSVNYNGLRKRETYDEIVDYLRGKQEMIKYPDRFAKRIREHPYLTQLDGEGLLEMEEQQENEWREKEKEHRVKEVSSRSSQTAPEVRTQMRREQGATSSTQYFDLGKQDAEMSEEMDWTVKEAEKRGRDMEQEDSKRRARNVEVLRSELSYSAETKHYAFGAASRAAETHNMSRSPPKSKAAPSSQYPPKSNAASSSQYPPSLPPPPPPKQRPTKTPSPPPPEVPPPGRKKPRMGLTAKRSQGPHPDAPPVQRVRRTAKVKHGTSVDENTSREYWEKRTKGYIVDQLGLRGFRGSVKGLSRKKKQELVDILLQGK